MRYLLSILLCLCLHVSYSQIGLQIDLQETSTITIDSSTITIYNIQDSKVIDYYQTEVTDTSQPVHVGLAIGTLYQINDVAPSISLQLRIGRVSGLFAHNPWSTNSTVGLHYWFSVSDRGKFTLLKL